MSEKWFYVQGNEKIGPVERSEMEALFKKGSLLKDSYVWTSGMENWTLLQEVKTFSHLFKEVAPPEIPTISPKKKFDWNSIDKKSQIFSIKIGPDRGTEEKILDQWFSIEQIIKFAEEKRVNEKTLIMALGMEEFLPLGECPPTKKIFPKIKQVDLEPKEKRRNERSPVVARVFFESEQKFLEGICINLSEGGMKILINDFPGTLGNEISMNVHKENPTFSFVAKGEIISVSEDKTGFGIKFNDLSQESRSTIKSILKNQ
ncbi:MAG: GYF domain-containing protein [Bacteriovoracales bacterium]